ncbi:hypothetical protein E2C01_044846 [Portunus trituberculatus]|uniref:Uncharacterized protein n=1 Tax=Portunus trituberculatus TaxID=210409 RepID=A0A5B7G0J8_PORTR|nr:hypothetical protein [Portunus trituberculatus]
MKYCKTRCTTLVSKAGLLQLPCAQAGHGWPGAMLPNTDSSYTLPTFFNFEMREFKHEGGSLKWHVCPEQTPSGYSGGTCFRRQPLKLVPASSTSCSS